MSIYKGSTLLAGNVSNGDAVTINTNSNDLLQAIGTINKNTSSFNYKYDWVGTFAQWQAQEIATTHPEWVCYIIDDSYDGVSVPTGTILPFGGVNAPEGFLICDGSAISRTTYSKLFNVIGESYGSGDGNSTFNIPNCTDHIPWQSPILDNGKSGNGVLPNITGVVQNEANNIALFNQAGTSSSGSLIVTSRSTSNNAGNNGTAKGSFQDTLTLNASVSSPLYVDGANVVVPSYVTAKYIIKY